MVDERGSWQAIATVGCCNQPQHIANLGQLPNEWKRYVFPKGYIAINGASLTVSDVNKVEGWFEVWLIPETRRMTVFSSKSVGNFVNIEIERGTQVVVDTVRDTLNENLGPLLPLFEKLLSEQGIDLDALGYKPNTLGCSNEPK